MKRQEYLDLKKKHEQELSDFPIAYAFNDEQLKEALVKLGADSVKECVSVFGHGDMVRKGDSSKLIDMLTRHTEEIKRKLQDDPEFAKEAFRYEMDNHEYAINWDGDGDVLAAFAINWADIVKWGLHPVWSAARKEHYKMMEEFGVI